MPQSSDCHVFWDLDDTLLHTSVLYEEARQTVAALIESYGYASYEIALAYFIANNPPYAVIHGFDRAVFPNFAESVLEYYAPDRDRLIRAEQVRQVRRVAYNVYARRAQTDPYTMATLRQLAAWGLPQTIISVGDPKVQARRARQIMVTSDRDQVIPMSDTTPRHLGHTTWNIHAPISTMHVVHAKDEITLATALGAHLVELPEYAVLIDNSRRNIAAAVAIGMHGIWLDQRPSQWTYEDHPLDGAHYHTAHTLSEVPAIVASCFGLLP